jgi:hypothetical protein
MAAKLWVERSVFVLTVFSIAHAMPPRQGQSPSARKHCVRAGYGRTMMARFWKRARNGRSTDNVPEAVVVRFAGDSGDGMQLTGGQFTLSTALSGNDLATFPDFPAEIRAPQGRCSASPPSRSTSAAPRSPPRAISPTCWWR